MANGYGRGYGIIVLCVIISGMVIHVVANATTYWLRIELILLTITLGTFDIGLYQACSHDEDEGCMSISELAELGDEGDWEWWIGVIVLQNICILWSIVAVVILIVLLVQWKNITLKYVVGSFAIFSAICVGSGLALMSIQIRNMDLLQQSEIDQQWSFYLAIAAAVVLLIGGIMAFFITLQKQHRSMGGYHTYSSRLQLYGSHRGQGCNRCNSHVQSYGPYGGQVAYMYVPPVSRFAPQQYHDHQPYASHPYPYATSLPRY